MNILTTQTNNYDDNLSVPRDTSWIAIGILSNENSKIFSDFSSGIRKILKEQGMKGKLGYGNGFEVPVKPGTKDTFEYFKPLFAMFKMQDVQKDGYMTLDEFYANYTNCYKTIKNPYLELEPIFEDFKKKELYIEALRNYYRMKYPKDQIIKVFDETKANKSIEEYLKEADLLDCYDAEEGKVFLNRRLYEGHMKYKKLHPEETKERIEQHKLLEELKQGIPTIPTINIEEEYEEIEDENKIIEKGRKR